MTFNFCGWLFLDFAVVLLLANVIGEEFMYNAIEAIKFYDILKHVLMHMIKYQLSEGK